MIKRLALLAMVIFFGLISKAQTITIDNANFSAVAYGAGGGITVPIRLNGCFNPGNNFQLELSDASGNYPGTIIGTYNGFFTPFVNGVIPAATTPGGSYTVRVVSTNPAGVMAVSPVFSVVATASAPVNNPVTSPLNTFNDTTFGRCQLNSSQNISLGITVPGGKTLGGKVLDSLGNTVSATINTSSIQFTMVPGNYYSVQVKLVNADNSISIKSYLVLVSTSNLSLQTSGANEICLPDLKEYTINTSTTGGIGNNYPGTTYSIDWGDGSVSTFTHCQLIQNAGAISHLYTQTSCGRPPITDITPNQNNAFRINVTAQNPYCSNGSFTAISSFAKVWDRPIANFNNPVYGCINRNITFTNTSQVGLSGANNAVNCTNNSMYEWYVDGFFVSTATHLVHSFATTGNHTVQLVAINDPCSDDTTMVICIEPDPVPDFLMNGLAVISGCAPQTIHLTNTTNANICRPFTYTWQVLRSPSLTPATPGVHYTITPSATDTNPSITFLVPGEYVVRLSVSNSCGTIVKDRNVTMLLDADVNLPPNQEYCGLRNIDFSVTPNHVVSYNVNMGALSYNWNISPATYTFLGGTSATSRYPQIQFNAYGTYTIQVTFNNDCGTDQATQQITFYESPTVNAGTDQQVCYPVNSVALNGSSAGPSGYTAAWSIQPGFGSGTLSNAGIPNPTYTFSATDKTNGTVRLIYTATPPAGSVCTPVRDTVVITIYPDNNITSAATASICSGTSLNYGISSTVPGSSYSWTSSVITGSVTGNTAVGNTALINDVLTNNATTGNAVVRYVITPTANGCTGNSLNVDVTVKALPDFTTTPSATVLCSGDQLTIGLSSPMAGTQYNWTSNFTGGTITGNTNQGTPATTGAIVNTLTNTGTTDVTLTYTITAFNTGMPVCQGETEQVVVTIKPPVTAAATSNSPVCVGQSINLTGNTPNTGVTYQWSGPNSFNSTNQNPVIPNAIPAYAGVYSLVVTAGGCSSPAASTTVVVNTAPVIGGATGTNPTSCAGATGSITLSGLSNNTSYTIQYNFNGNPQSPLTLTSNGSGSLVIPNLTAGVYNNITASISGCASSAAGPVTLVDPSAPNIPAASGNSPVCSGGTINLNASTSSAGVATYNWSGPNGFTSSTQNPSITNALMAAGGTYHVTATINNCTSGAGTVTIVVDSTPAVPVAGNNGPLCTGSTLNLTASSASGAGYSWTGPSFSSTTQNPSITNVTIAHAGAYQVTATLGNCTSAAATTTVVINETPNISGSHANNPSSCASATGSIVLDGLSPATTFLVHYTQNGTPLTATLTSNSSGTVTIPGLAAGTYTNVFVALNNCSSNSVGPFSLADPTPPAVPVATSDAPICSGNTLHLTASSATPGVGYNWSGPNGFFSNQQNPSITNAPLASAGIYSVTATLNGCTSAAATVNVIINETPVLPIAANNGPLCTGATLNLTAGSATSGVTYSWTGPNSFNSSLQNPSVANVSTAEAGVYSVVATATTSGCSSAAATTTVVINQTPTISISGSANPSNCASATGSISLNGLSPSTSYNVLYTFNAAPQSVSLSSDAGGVLTIPNLVAGTYANIHVQLTGCSSNMTGPISLTDPNPPATPVASANSPLCQGETILLTASTATPGAVTYSWTGPAGFNSQMQHPSVINAGAANSGTYFVIATLNNCSSAPASVAVDVRALPAAPTVTTPVNYCIDAPSVALTATPAPGNTLKWYNTATGGTGSTTAPIPSTTTSGTTAYYVSQVTSLGCEGTRALIEVNVNPDARAEFTYAPFESCAPFNISSSVIQPVLYPNSNSVYQWYANDVLIGSGTSFPGYTITNAADSVRIKLKTISLFGCKNDSTEQWFYTPASPVTNFIASDTVGCGPLAVSFTNTTPQPGDFSFNWNFGNGITSALANPGTITFQPNPTTGDTVYHVSLTAFTACDTIIKTIAIRVKSKPRALITPDKTYGCSPLTVSFNNISLGANMTFEWNFGDGSPSFFTNNTSPVQHTFNTGRQDTFYVRLIATNSCGSDTGYYNIVVAARTINLDVAINGNETTGCSPHSVTFFNHSTGATNFVWDFGDGNLLTTTSNLDTVVHTYITTGSFNVLVKASNGCTDTSLIESIAVFAKPLVNYTVVPTPVCVGDTLYFTNQSDTVTGLLWNFGDGITSQLGNPVHAYQSPGTYQVKLIGIRQYAPGNACTDSITKQITVVASLPGNFTVSDSVSNCAPFTVVFTNRSVPAVFTAWDFGDGHVDTGDIVSHMYVLPGTYTATMTARDLNGCNYVHTKQIVVNGASGSFVYDHGVICGNTPVRFQANTVGADSIRWHFGDGVSLTTSNNIVYHVYTQPGVFIPSIELLSGTAGSCRRLIWGADTIKIEYTSAGFVTAEVKSCGSTTVSFSDTSDTFFGTQSWQWNFGDGNTSQLQHPVHVYTTSNTWPVQLITTSAAGCADTANIPLLVKVNSKPEATIIHDSVGCTNHPVTYNSVVISPDPVTYYSWTFSNLATGNTATVQNIYAAPGTYTAQLIAGTGFGCYDTTSSVITIHPSPNVRTNPDMVICRGESAHLNTTGGLTYTWAPFTGLSCTTCPNPVASPLTTTQYVVTGYNSFGCATSDTLLITVPQPFDVDVSANTVMCIGESRQLIANGATTYLWSPAATLSAANIPNPVATPTTTTVYRVIGFDAYNCFRDTAYVTVAVGDYPVVHLGRDTVLATGTLLTLSPAFTNGPMATWSWTPATDLSCANCPSPIATIKKDICYSVTATNFFGCSGKDTVCIRVFCINSQVFIPNAFTPDADGINDRLVVRAKGVKLVKSFRIFNRWGQLVFEKSNFSPNADNHGWDGTVKGIAAPPDVYVYTCEVLCEDDTPYTYKGNVAILK